MEKKVTTKEFRNWLLGAGFTYEDKDFCEVNGYFEVFEFETTDVYLYRKGKVDISFAHSASGYYKIENANPDEIKAIISTFKRAHHISTDNLGEMPKQHFKITMLQILKDFYFQQPSKT